MKFILLGIIFNILWNNIECYVSMLGQPCPLIIADECLKLKNTLNNNSTIFSIMDYQFDKFAINNVKNMYKHSYEIGLIQELLHDSNHVRIINMRVRELPKVQSRYSVEAQSFNILRAFQNGNYGDIDKKMFNKKLLKEYERRKKYIETKHHNNHNHGNFGDLYFFTENVLYNGKMRRKDSFHNIWVDTSRHLILVEDVKLRKKMSEYVESIENPIGIICRGRSSNKNLLKLIRRLLQSRKDSKLMIIFSMSKLQSSKRQISTIMETLSTEEKNQIVFCMEMMISSRVSSNKILKNIEFFKKIIKHHNRGYYFKCHFGKKGKNKK